MRHLLIFGLLLGLVGPFVLPFANCVPVLSAASECAPPKVATPCDQMAMDESSANLSATQDHSCCRLRSALPELQYNVAGQTAALHLVSVSELSNELVIPQANQVATAARDVSPPPLRSLLCTFLI